jgi:hypothetical protein
VRMDFLNWIYILGFLLFMALYLFESHRRRKLEQDRLDRLNGLYTDTDKEVRRSKAGEHREARKQGVDKKNSHY